MVQVFVGVGSNIDRENNIRSGLSALRQVFGEIKLSPVYESVAVGFEGRNFLNLVVSFETALEPHAVAKCLREIEDRHGRDRSAPRYSSRMLDLDMLLFDDLVFKEGDLDVPRSDILRYAYVLRPLAELAPDHRHPESGERFADLWSRFDSSSNSVWPAAIEFSA